MKAWLRFTSLTLTAALCGCTEPAKSVRGFHPPRGDASRGKAAFIELRCTRCHTVDGESLPRPLAPASTIVALGGEVPRLQTVGDLLTSIIHPGYENSHPGKMPILAANVRSSMPVVNEHMTVMQMVDLVAFLQPHYSLIPPPYGWELTP